MDDLFGAVDALLEQAKPLPEPAERLRLREAAGLSRPDIASAFGVSTSTVTGWETGRSEPTKQRRAAYARLLEGLAQRYPASAEPQVSAPESGGRASSPQASATPPQAPTAAAESAAAVPAPTSASTTRSRTSTNSRRPAAKTASKAPASSPAGTTADAKYPAGPLAVLDGDGAAHLVDGRALDCPAATVAQLVDWALGAGLGQERLHRAGRDADPLVVLTAAAVEHLGLPGELADRRGLRLPDDHQAVRDVVAAGWQLTKRGFGPWARVYRPVEAGGARQCVQLAILPWGALDSRSWPGVDQLPASDIARVLSTYATRVLTPRGSTAVSGLELMTALRPPTRAVRSDAGAWTSGVVPGSLTRAVEPAPPEAPAEHPVAQGRPEDQVLEEEAYEWVRGVELLDDDECAQPFAVGLDVNMAFAAAANRLSVGLGEAVHTDGPRFDKSLPGAWYVDLSGVEIDPRLPNPFTPSGQRPTGPAWYATPTLAYAVELGADVRPLEAWIRPEAGPYLDPW
ncbi:XRE family transcriptional regulator, partial [Streptomyces sp. 8K308]|uniref:telomere-associated protein Tap n=1 Tax=Streptomyces sp. 8K308 TaxID=2530388 RepID=UPI001052F645